MPRRHVAATGGGGDAGGGERGEGETIGQHADFLLGIHNTLTQGVYPKPVSLPQTNSFESGSLTGTAPKPRLNFSVEASPSRECVLP
jgi:hypothetical protein